MEGEGASETGEGSKRKRGPEEESLISFGHSSDKDFELDWEDIARFQGDTEFKGYKFPTISELDEMVEDLEDTLSSHMRKKGRDYIELKLDGGPVYGHFILHRVRKTSSIQDIKEMIEDSQQIKLNRQDLKFQGVTLADEEVVEGIPGLMDGSVIHIVPTKGRRGGGRKRRSIPTKGRRGGARERRQGKWGQFKDGRAVIVWAALGERMRIPTRGRRGGARERRQGKWGQFKDGGRAVIVWAALGERMRGQRFRRLQANRVEGHLA